VRTLVVLPTYQEAENITDVLGRIRAALPDAGILVVDDNSPDGTGDLAEEAATELGDVQVLRRGGKEGLGSAYRAGFKRGLADGAEILIEIDADLSHDPADLPRLVAAIEDGADLAVGSRYVPGGATPSWPAHRRQLSRWANRYATTVLGLPMRDATAGFRAYRAEILAKLNFDEISADGYGFQIEMAFNIAKLGGRITELPITFRDRQRGTSKMSGSIIVEAMSLVTWWALRDRVFARFTRRTIRP
jgi:dolichol-phosphate mannosyltransferase